MRRAERRALVEDEASALPVSRQCQLVSVLRTSLYRRPAPVSAEDGTIVSLIVYLARPYYGSRRVRAWLVTQSRVVNGNRVQRPLRARRPCGNLSAEHEPAGAKKSTPTRKATARGLDAHKRRPHLTVSSCSR